MCNGNCKNCSNKKEVQYSVYEEMDIDGRLEIVYLQWNQATFETLEEAEETRIYLQPDFLNKLRVVVESKEIIK